MKTEGIDPDTFKKQNNVLNNMKKEYDVKEMRMQDRVKDLESKLKFQVETQELIDVKNMKINELEETLSNLKDAKGSAVLSKAEKENAGSKNKNINNKEKDLPLPKTKKDQKIIEKSQNMDLEVMNKTLKEQNLIKTKKIEELTKNLEDTEQSHIDKIRQLRQENNIRNMALLEKDVETNIDKNEDDMKGRELLINYCALLKDLSRIRSYLSVDEMHLIIDELEVIMRSYNTKQVKSLSTFKTKVLAQLKDLNDVNKVHRLQRVKVVINK